MPLSPPPPPPPPPGGAQPAPPCKTGDGTCCCPPQFSSNPVQYANGTAPVIAYEVRPARKHRSFGHQRRYSNQRSGSYSSVHGYNWWSSELPYAASPGTNIVAITFNSDLTYWFDKVGSTYVPRYAFLNVSLVEDTIAETFTFADASDGQTETTVFNSLAAASNPGAYLWNIDAGGVKTTATLSGGLITETQRTYTIGGVITIESILYAYYTSGSATGLLQTVTYRTQVGGGSWTPIEQGAYTYYGSSDPNGSLNDLQTASQQLPDGMGGWNTVGVEYYRYWLAGSTTGYAHAMKMHFGQEAYRLMFNAGINPLTASDATVLPYADHYFEYDPTAQFVTKEISAVCASCPGGGTTADLFSYSTNPHYPGDGFGIWKTKTVQTLPDSSQIVVYSSYASLPILRVHIDSTGSNMWGTFYRYDSNGQVIWVAQPSAVALPPSLATLEAYDDLLNYSGGSYAYLNDSTGLINVTGYDANMNVTSQAVRNGQAGSDIPVASFTYISNTDANGIIIYLPATSVAYPNAADATITITTSFAYTFYSGTNQISQRTTTLPVVSTAQNGSNAADTIVEEYDTYGNRTQFVDERGIINNYTWDVVKSRMTQQVLNYQSGVTAPGVNVTTDFTYDDLGRPTTSIGPSHTVVLSGTATAVQPVTWSLYNQSALPGSAPWPVDSTWTANGYFDGTNYTLIDPVTLSNMDKDGRSTDVITSVRTSGSGALSASDTFAQTDWQNWASKQYDEQHRTISGRVYHNIPTSGIGTSITNYGETDFGYDALERQNRVVAPGGTITRTVWTCPQWILSTWVGTNDTGATDADPTGGGAAGNNMVQITLNQWDGGTAGGDGNLTQQTQYVSATSGDTRVTAFGHDFRDRRISVTDATNRYALTTLDNLGRPTMRQRYATLGGNLISQTAANWDDRSRIYQSIVYAVDPSTGTVGNALTGNMWYDPSGNVLQQIPPGAGQVFTKSEYNPVNWVTASYIGYNTSGYSYTQAGTVSGDIIIEQKQNTFDEVGNLVSAASFQRLNDESPTVTGALSYGTSPKARVSYGAGWFDGIDRTIASANYGAVASFTRPTAPPSSSATVLVSGKSYDNASRVYQTTDPKGIIAQNGYDNANRKIQTIEDVGGIARTTNFTYTLDNLTASMTAVNSSTGDQTTTYLYGTTLADSGVARNDLLLMTTYPDTRDGWADLTVDDWANLSVDDWATLAVNPYDSTASTYNRLGQPLIFTDQRNTRRAFLYDKLGRQTDDCVITVGVSTDNAVLRISTGYEIRGMVNLVTSYDNATPGSGTILNQVAMTFNSFAQLTKEQQDHSGAVSGSSPSVQYAYDTGTSGSNEIRFTTLTYPNGRIITYSFGTSGGMNDLLNRVDTIQDTTSGTVNLVSYSYLGLRAVIKIDYPEPQVNLDLWGGSSGTFTGFDLFGRIINQPWNNYNTGTMLDQYQYGYDQNSNRIWKANIVSAAASVPLDEFYNYDNLSRLTEMQRGTLNGGKTGITGTPTIEQDWTLDPTGNWSNFLAKSAGTTDLNQTRTSNPVNEITNITESTGPTWIVPAYDPAGNTTTMPQTASPSSSFDGIYDAWNRMVAVSATGTTVVGYVHDGINRRIIRLGYTSGVLSETRHFYFTASGRDVEQRVGASTSMDQQHVWGIRYINELVCADDATPQRLFVCQDAIYNVTALVATGGGVAQRFLYDPYGSQVVLDVSWAGTTDAYNSMYTFQAGFFDHASGLIKFGIRDYAPRLGGWEQRDPSGYFDGTSLYNAFAANPVNRADPFGLQTDPSAPPSQYLITDFTGNVRWASSFGPNKQTDSFQIQVDDYIAKYKTDILIKSTGSYVSSKTSFNNSCSLSARATVDHTSFAATEVYSDVLTGEHGYSQTETIVSLSQQFTLIPQTGGSGKPSDDPLSLNIGAAANSNTSVYSDWNGFLPPTSGSKQSGVGPSGWAVGARLESNPFSLKSLDQFKFKYFATFAFAESDMPRGSSDTSWYCGGGLEADYSLDKDKKWYLYSLATIGFGSRFLTQTDAAFRVSYSWYAGIGFNF